MIVNEESLCFRPLVGQTKQFEDITLGSGKLQKHYKKSDISWI